MHAFVYPPSWPAVPFPLALWARKGQKGPHEMDIWWGFLCIWRRFFSENTKHSVSLPDYVFLISVCLSLSVSLSLFFFCLSTSVSIVSAADEKSNFNDSLEVAYTHSKLHLHLYAQLHMHNPWIRYWKRKRRLKERLLLCSCRTHTPCTYS